MAMSKLEAIMELFSLYGKAETPVAIIQDGTTTKEKMVTGTVCDIAYRAQYAGMSNPSIIVIGEVVNLSAAIKAGAKMEQPASSLMAQATLKSI